MEDRSELKILDLFSSLGIIEKGIEKIYHFLLINKKIDNLKSVCEQFNFSLKRGYKICSVLSEMELVQIYDRPMKVLLSTPLPSWQKLVSQKIEELEEEFKQKSEACENSLNEFINNFNLEEEVIQEPVEFVNFSTKDFIDIFYQYTNANRCRLAIGIQYENPLVKNFTNSIQESMVISKLNELKENLKKIDIQIIFNAEIVKILLKSKEFKIIHEHLASRDLIFTHLDVRVTEEDFSNFSLTDTKFIQPCFDPTKKLLGLFVSRNKSIFDIFLQKFEELFSKGENINTYLKKTEELGVDSLSETEKYTLSLL